MDFSFGFYTCAKTSKQGHQITVYLPLCRQTYALVIKQETSINCYKTGLSE